MITRSHARIALGIALAACGCDKPSSSAGPDASSFAATSPSSPPAIAMASAAPSASAMASAVPKAGGNALTPERRAKIEAAIPEAKDFVDARELGEEVADKPDFLRAWQELVAKKAGGKWILFRGAMNDLQKDTFAIAVTMMEIDPNSPIGAPKWIVLHAKEIKGYDASKYEAGAYGAVLAKYVGGKTLEIKPGFDVMALGCW